MGEGLRSWGCGRRARSAPSAGRANPEVVLSRAWVGFQFQEGPNRPGWVRVLGGQQEEGRLEPALDPEVDPRLQSDCSRGLRDGGGGQTMPTPLPGSLRALGLPVVAFLPEHDPRLAGSDGPLGPFLRPALGASFRGSP